jgi:ribulose-5-phosphate 4-epimerase/fuculose-1-phosphate aldolase
LTPAAYEPELADRSRYARLALAYRVFVAMGWGSLGDGHDSARDRERVECFRLGRYGVPFKYMTTDDLVLVRTDGTLEGGGYINMAAYYIHAPVHEARPDIVSAAHCHTPYGTPFSATVTRLEPISQESCAFFDDHEIFDDEEVSIGSTDGGKRIAAAMGGARAAILRNHGFSDGRRYRRRCSGLLPADGALRRGSGESPWRTTDRGRVGPARPRRVRRNRRLAGLSMGAANPCARRRCRWGLVALTKSRQAVRRRLKNGSDNGGG